MKTKYFHITKKFDQTKINSLTAGRFLLFESGAVKSSKIFFDTFDFRLLDDGKYLCYSGGIIFLYSKDDAIIFSKKFGNNNSEIDPNSLIEDTDLSELIGDSVGLRALLPKLEIEESRHIYSALNEDKKTVARLNFLNLFEKSKPLNSKKKLLIEVDPVRGYRKEFKQICSIIRKQKNFNYTAGGYFDALLNIFNITPLDFNSKCRISLSKNLSTSEAVRKILLELLRRIKLNESGIQKNIDIEFLHDYRIAVRKVRSALKQFKKVFTKSEFKKLSKDFSKIGQYSNAVRDLDVFLLQNEKLKRLLPARLEPGLEPLFAGVLKERNIELLNLTEFLNSDKYRKIIAGSEKYFTNKIRTNKKLNSFTGRPISETAKDVLLNKFKKVIMNGKKINKDSPDSYLHNLRILGKEFRYSLEFFISLFDTDKIKVLTSHLKQLQTTLGNFNDICVQQEKLSGYLSNQDNSQRSDKMTTAAIGGIIAELNHHKAEARNSFFEVFDKFCSKKNVKLANTLFNPGNKK